MEILKIRNLSFYYPDSERAALNEFSLTVNEGEFVTVFGKSGCGKSTLLRLINPPLAPRGKLEGVIERCGDYAIGMVMQSPEEGIVTDKVWHELAFGLENLGLKTDEIRARVAETASFFGINSWFDKKTNELSGGQKQLLALASVMVTKPSLLLLDEPTSQLDPIAAGEFLAAVKRINRETGVTVILSEHRLEEAIPISDRVVYMENGAVAAQNQDICPYLKDSGMLAALPSPMRIHTAVKNNMTCPQNVREGRMWLDKMVKDRGYTPVPLKHTESSNDTVLTMKNVWFRYQKELPDVVKGINLKLKKGEVMALMGGNGSGKSTALSIAAGVLKPVCGRVEKKGRTGLLPQSPETIFLCDTVLEDLRRFGNTDEIEQVCSLCGLEDIVLRAPSDISGGELQRAALAAVLLTKPDILLLDEPTKGMDAEFKQEFGRILQGLKDSGMAICIVSHDVEFCAEYADTCGLFFEGAVVSSGNPQEFFAGLSYYTTSACRMSDGIIDNAVTSKDIIAALGGIEQKRDIIKNTFKLPPEASEKQKKEPDYPSGIICLLIFAVISLFITDKFTGLANTAFMILSIAFLGFGISFLVPQTPFEEPAVNKKRRFHIRHLLVPAILMLIVPATVYCGIRFFEERRYYLISMLIIFETIAAFAAGFEGSKPKPREIVVVSVLCAIGVAGREAFFMLPQFKPIAAIVIISGAALGSGTGFLTGAMCAFVSNFFFGQGAWTPWQMFSFGLIGALSGVFFYGRRKTRGRLCVFGALAVLIIYGLIMNPASVIMAGDSINPSMLAVAVYAGLPFDIVHAASTVFFLWFGAAPVIKKLAVMKKKYGIYQDIT